MTDCPCSSYASCCADSLATATAVAVRRAAAVGGCLLHPSECLDGDAAQRSPCHYCYSKCGCCDHSPIVPTTADVNEPARGRLRCHECPYFCSIAEGDDSLPEPVGELFARRRTGQYHLCRFRCCRCRVCTAETLCENEGESAVVPDLCNYSPVSKPVLPAAAPSLIELESSVAADAAGSTLEQNDGAGDVASPAVSCQPTVVGREAPGPVVAGESSGVPAGVDPSTAGPGLPSTREPAVGSDTLECREGAVVPRLPSRSFAGNLPAASSSIFRAPQKQSVARGASQAPGQLARVSVGEPSAAASSTLKQSTNVSSSPVAPEGTDKSLQARGASGDAAAAAIDAASSQVTKRLTMAERVPHTADWKGTADGGANRAAAAADKETRDELSAAAAGHSTDPPVRDDPTYMSTQHAVTSDQGSMGMQPTTPTISGLLPELSMLHQAEAEALVAAVAPQFNLAAFFEILKEAGIVLVRREDAQWWATQLAQHKHQSNAMRAQLKAKSAEAAEAHRKLQNQAKTVQESTTRLLSNLKATKMLEQALATATTDLEAERETSKRLQRDKKDLTEALQQDRRKAETRNSAYRKNLKGLGDVQDSLTEELAAERMEKRELKKLFEEKLVHIQQQQDNWQQQIDRQDSVVQRWKEMLAQERSERQGAEMQQQRLSQLRQQTEVNDKLQRDFEAVNGRLQRLERRRRENQLDWMRDHLQKVDARRESRNSGTQHDAMAQVEIDPVFGEPFPPLDITTTHCLKRPFVAANDSLPSAGAWVRPEEVTY